MNQKGRGKTPSVSIQKALLLGLIKTNVIFEIKLNKSSEKSVKLELFKNGIIRAPFNGKYYIQSGHNYYLREDDNGKIRIGNKTNKGSESVFYLLTTLINDINKTNKLERKMDLKNIYQYFFLIIKIN